MVDSKNTLYSKIYGRTGLSSSEAECRENCIVAGVLLGLCKTTCFLPASLVCSPEMIVAKK